MWQMLQYSTHSGADDESGEARYISRQAVYENTVYFLLNIAMNLKL